MSISSVRPIRSPASPVFGMVSIMRLGIHTQPRDPVEQLVAGSRELMADALQAYGEDRPLKVATSAPVAIEQLAKAVLWRTNPALLVTLDRAQEDSLLILTSAAPSLAHPRLRTVGLDAALRRIPEAITGTVSKESRQELISARNGAVHVGQARESASILTTALKLSNCLLEALGLNPADYYHPHAETVTSLLNANRSEVQQRVDQKKARARFRWEERRELGIDQLTAIAQRGLDSNLDDYYVGTVARPCPVCDYEGALGVYLDVGFEIDAEWSDGEQTTSVHPFWEVSPFEYACHVCGLRVSGSDELVAAGLPTGTLVPDENELHTDWTVGEFLAENPTSPES